MAAGPQCPSCGESEALRGTPVENDIAVTCEKCVERRGCAVRPSARHAEGKTSFRGHRQCLAVRAVTSSLSSAGARSPSAGGAMPMLCPRLCRRTSLCQRATCPRVSSVPRSVSARAPSQGRQLFAAPVPTRGFGRAHVPGRPLPEPLLRRRIAGPPRLRNRHQRRASRRPCVKRWRPFLPVTSGTQTPRRCSCSPRSWVPAAG
jgi:hypothetical protein